MKSAEEGNVIKKIKRIHSHCVIFHVNVFLYYYFNTSIIEPINTNSSTFAYEFACRGDKIKPITAIMHALICVTKRDRGVF